LGAVFNLGLLYLQSQRLAEATDVLRLATPLGPDRPETHFNLGLVYERRAMLGPPSRRSCCRCARDGTSLTR